MRRALRWVLGFVIVAAVVSALAALAAWYVVAFTDVPRRRIVAAIEEATGLAVRIDASRTSWSGITTLAGLSVSLPGEAEPMLTADRVEVEHAALLSLVRSGDAAVAWASVGGAKLTLRQADDGRWNAHRAASLIAARAQEHKRPPTPPPSLRIRDGTVIVAAIGQKPHTVAGVELIGDRLAPGGYALTASAGDQRVAAQLDLGADLHHTVTIDVNDAHALAGPLFDDVARPITVQAAWRGRRDGAALTGMLSIAEAGVGGDRWVGRAAVTADPREPRLQIRPDRVQMTPRDEAIGPIILTGGRLMLDAMGVTAEGVTAEAMGTVARIDGRYNALTGEGEAESAWRGERIEPAISHSGTARAAIKPAAPGSHAVTVTLSTRGRSPAGAWSATLTASAEGVDAEHATWRVAFERGAWTLADQRIAQLDGLTLAGRIDGPVIELVDAKADGAHGELSAKGSYDRATQRWSLNAAGKRFAPPIDGVVPVDLTLVAGGDAGSAELTKLTASMGDATLEASGTYEKRRTTAIDLAIEATWRRAIQGRDEAGRGVPWDVAASWSGRVTGSAEPLMLTATGEAELTHVRVNGHDVPDTAAPVTATWAHGRLAVNVQTLAVLGGEASIGVEYAFGDETIDVAVRGAGVSLAQAGVLAGVPVAIEGVVDGELRLVVPRGDPSDVRADADVVVTRFTLGPLAFDRMVGVLRTRRDGVVRLDPLTIERGGGTGTGVAVFNLRDAPTLHVTMQGTNWPVELGGGVSGRIGGSISGDADLMARTAVGRFELDAALTDGEGDIGRVTAAGELTPDAVKLSKVRSSGLSGEAVGEATIPLADWRLATGELRWSGLEPAVLAKWWPIVEGTSGRVDVDIKAGPTAGDHPLEPIRFDVFITPVDALSWRRVPIGPAQFTGYAGPTRCIVDQSSITLADGELRLWSSLTRREARWYGHLRGDWERLNLDLLRLAMPGQADDEPIPGRLAGRGGLIGPLDDIERMVGQGDMRLSESNLRGTNIFGTLIALMGGGTDEPTGRGTVTWRVQRKAMRIDRLYYFNSGTQVLLSGQVQDITRGADSPIVGDAVGVLRPLAGIELAPLADLDRLLRAYQTGWTRVRINGTLRDPDVTPAPLADLGLLLRRITGGGGEADDPPPP